MISNVLILEYIERLRNLVPLYVSGSKQAHEELRCLISNIKLSLKKDIPELNEVNDGYNTHLDRSANTVIELLKQYACEDTREEKMMIRANNKVFIVHGHDESIKFEVARTLEKAGFEVIILHEQANNGRTILEKIEDYSDVIYAVVLYTPCDMGRAKDADISEEQFRARQNVVFEHGYLIGKLGRQRVSAIVKGNIEIPGDIEGVVYIKYDDANGWKQTLAKDMKEAGIAFDLNKL